MNVALSRELSFLKISFLRPRRNYEVPSRVATITFDPTWFHYWFTSCHASMFSPSQLLFLHFDFYCFIIYIMGHCYLFILLLFVHHQVLYHSIAMIHIYCLVFASFVIFCYHNFSILEFFIWIYCLIGQISTVNIFISFQITHWYCFIEFFYICCLCIWLHILFLGYTLFVKNDLVISLLCFWHWVLLWRWWSVWLFLLVSNLHFLTECLRSAFFIFDVIFCCCEFYIQYF